MRSLRSIADLCRVSNLPTVFSNVLAAWFLGGGHWEARLGGCALGAALCYCGGMILNDVCDADWDRRHQKPRPIPRGEISRNSAASLGWGSLGAGLGVLLWLGANPAWVLGLLTGIVSYNRLHKRWPGASGLMAACRFFLFISVASIAAEALPLGLPVWLWAAALACYVAGITLAAQREVTSSGVHPGALVLLLLPFACALFSLPLPGPHLAWPLLLMITFASWLFLAYRLLSAGGQVGPFVSRLLAGMVLVDALALSAGFPQSAFLCVLLLPLNHFLQRFVSPT